MYDFTFSIICMKLILLVYQPCYVSCYCCTVLCILAFAIFAMENLASLSNCELLTVYRDNPVCAMPPPCLVSVRDIAS